MTVTLTPLQHAFQQAYGEDNTPQMQLDQFGHQALRIVQRIDTRKDLDQFIKDLNEYRADYFENMPVTLQNIEMVLQEKQAKHQTCLERARYKIGGFCKFVAEKIKRVFFKVLRWIQSVWVSLLSCSCSSKVAQPIPKQTPPEDPMITLAKELLLKIGKGNGKGPTDVHQAGENPPLTPITWGRFMDQKQNYNKAHAGQEKAQVGLLLQNGDEAWLATFNCADFNGQIIPLNSKEAAATGRIYSIVEEQAFYKAMKGLVGENARVKVYYV